VTSLLLLTLLSQAPARVTLVFGGDVIPHDPVKAVAQRHALDGHEGSLNNDGWDHVFGPLAPVFRRNDLAIVNLETPIVVLRRPEKGDMIFHGPPAMLAALKKAGVSIATFANNHCLDQHREGITSTRDSLRAAGLLSAGADVDEASAWTPLVVEKNGLRLGVLAVGRFINGFNNTKDPAQPHVPVVAYPQEPIVGSHTIEQLVDTVRARAAEVDALVVFIHWGDEYKSQPRADDRALAQQLLDAGAAAVIGHHPHVLQPVEWMTRADGTKGLVAFSLGNLVSNQDYEDEAGLKRDGLLLELELSRPGPGARAEVTRVGGVPVFTDNRLGAGKRRNVQPVVLDDELAAMQERLAALEGRVDTAAKKERKALTRRLAIATARRDRIQRVYQGALLDTSGAAAMAAPAK
jgi:poly-gamma-glutamate capsule biosynthesis protein CapA/YwtB (metallophosphatase superfamily)